MRLQGYKMCFMNQPHEFYMRRCLALAEKGEPHPNPYVGAVLVDENGKIVAEGYHKRAGESHAEAIALRKLKTTTQNLKLYINLEPCTFFGRKPPCVNEVIASGIKKIIIAMRDPNPLVNGKGIAALRCAGIDVTVGVLKKEARRLNEQFITFHTKHRPFIALKLAATLDGKIASRTGDSKWITSKKMRAYTRTLRAQYQSILIGINTVLQDDPHLGVRIRGKRDPVRIILDSRLRIPLSAKALRDNNVIIAGTARAGKQKIKSLQKRGIPVWICAVSRDGLVHLPCLMERMRAANIISCFVEGGGRVASSFLKEGLVDKVYWALAPKILGDEKTISAATHLKSVSYKQIGDNMLLEAYAH